jgi:hypothetical protein
MLEETKNVVPCHKTCIPEYVVTCETFDLSSQDMVIKLGNNFQNIW